MVSSAQKKRAVLTGPALVNAFLEELSKFIRRSPDHEYEGTPREIVEAVVLRTTRFGECQEECLNSLTKQIAMAVQAKGRTYHLRYEMLSGGQIKVSFA